MTNAELLDTGLHVRLTRHVMDVDLQLDRLLELTRGLAPAGSAALQLILPVVDEVVRPNWSLLGRIGLSPLLIGNIGERLDCALSDLQGWSGVDIDSAFESTASFFESPIDSVRALASVFVIGELTRLPVTEVFELMGRDRFVKRLRNSTMVYKSMQMIG